MRQVPPPANYTREARALRVAAVGFVAGFNEVPKDGDDTLGSERNRRLLRAAVAYARVAGKSLHRPHRAASRAPRKPVATTRRCGWCGGWR